jgi:hypothetical protein
MEASLLPSNLSLIDMDIFKYQNLARTNPQSLIPDLEEMLARFEGNNLMQ